MNDDEIFSTIPGDKFFPLKAILTPRLKRLQ